MADEECSTRAASDSHDTAGYVQCSRSGLANHSARERIEIAGDDIHRPNATDIVTNAELLRSVPDTSACLGIISCSRTPNDEETVVRNRAAGDVNISRRAGIESCIDFTGRPHSTVGRNVQIPRAGVHLIRVTAKNQSAVTGRQGSPVADVGRSRTALSDDDSCATDLRKARARSVNVKDAC